MLSFFSGIGGKIMAGFAAAGVFILALMGMQRRARKDERNKIEGESAREEVGIMKDARREHKEVREGGASAARDRMQRRRLDRMRERSRHKRNG